MKLIKTAFLAGAGFACLAATTPQDAQTLQRTLTENTTEVYKIDTKVDQTLDSQQLGEVPMTVTTGMTYKIKTNKVDPATGSANVEVTVTVDKMDADGQLGAMLSQQQIKPIVQTGTIDKYGHMSLKAPAGGDMMQMAMSGSQAAQSSVFIELPNHPVKLNDTWDIKVPASAFTGPEDQVITAKLAGDKTLDGKSVWVVDVSGTIKSSFDTSKFPSSGDSSPLANLKMLVKGSMQVNGEGFVDKATGRTVSYTTGGKMTESISMPDHDMTFDSSGTYTSTVKLQG
jgi:hypothetical protein